MKKKTQSQPSYQTPSKKNNIQTMNSPNSNSNSFSQIFQSYYPRTPVRKVNQQKKDQLGQVMEKGVSKFAIVTQVTFNSTIKFKEISLSENFAQFQVYDRRNKISDQEWSLLNQKSASQITSKTQLFYTLTNIYQQYKIQNDRYFMISNAIFLAFFSYSTQKIPYCIFITRQEANKQQFSKSQFLQQKQIESIVLGVETPLSVLFPQNHTSFPTKYTLSLIQKKFMQHLFNYILNIALEKEIMDVAANFQFHNSYFNSIQTYNGVDQIENETQNLFDNNVEYKIQFEGLFNIQQIIDLKNKLQQTNQDIVVSDIKLNPLTTLINDKLLEQIDNNLK